MMKIKIWGCRGSIPTPGKSTIKYGGNTSCIEVRLKDGSVIIFDAGSGIRKLGKKIIREESCRELYLVLTHSHWDHLMGFPFFLPAYRETFTINVRGGPIAKESVKKYLEHQMEAPYFPARFSSLKANFDFSHGIPIVRRIGTAELIPIPLSHPNGGFGFRLQDKDASFVFLTDNELGHDHDGRRSYTEYINFAKNADLLLHDAQYTPQEYKRSKGWGHSTFVDAALFALHSEVKNYGIFHHDPDHSDGDIERIEAVSREIIGRKQGKTHSFAVYEEQEINLP
jgi:phosphoribosyl 1,2-cyclic phosphodiesterase